MFSKKNLNASRTSLLGCGTYFIEDSRIQHSTVCMCVVCFLKKNQNAPRPSEHPPVRGGEMSKRLGGIKGCKYKTSSWHLNGFPDRNNIGSTFFFPFILDIKWTYQPGSHRIFHHLPSAVPALIFLARKIPQVVLSRVEYLE